MSHKRALWKPKYRTREQAPIFSKDKQGNSVLLCPFCTPPHPLTPNSPALCGSVLQVRVVQQIYHSAKYGDEVCVKCGKGGGDMVVFQGALCHVNDCMPGVVALNTPPKFSRMAGFIYNMKLGRMKKTMEKIYGRAVPVQEVTARAERTGNILGYFFDKKRGKNGTNRESQRAQADT